MSTHHDSQVRPFDLRAAERQAMAEHGFEPDFPPEVERELSRTRGTSTEGERGGQGPEASVVVID